MKKSAISLLLVLTVLLTPLLSTSLAVTDNNEIDNLRNSIKSVDDMDNAMFSSLEAAILKKYTDVKKDDWYMSVMIKLVGLSALDGSVNNTLDPLDTVTRAMFIKLFIRAMYGVEGLEGLTPSFKHWAALDVKKAEEIGILSPGEYVPSNMTDPITRGEMAKIIVRAYKKFEKNPLTEIDCKPLSTVIRDYNQIAENQKADVLIAYGTGIISGYKDGRFAANDVATRAQAAAFIIRYLDKRERAKVEIPKNEAEREPMVLRYDDPNRPMAIEGDTFVKPDGTKVILEVGPSGVLGEEQGCATEIGRAHPNGELIEDGDLCSNEKFLGQPYLVDEETGEGHYIREWHAIAERLRNDALEELGHPADGTTYGSWLRYSHGQWVWTGPVR